jgi:Ca2+-binding RTX toxin-like protein
MTTYTVDAFRLIDGETANPVVMPVTVEIVMTDGAALSYVVTDPNGEFLPQVEFNDAAGILRIDGVVQTGFDTYFGYVTWTEAGAPRSAQVLELMDEASGSSVIFALGGDPLPQITSAADVLAFDGSITGMGAILSGPYAPGQPISPAWVPGVRISENDLFTGFSGEDAFDGGIGRDVLYGLGGSDSLSGGAGRDKLLGGTGQDSLSGDAGDDLLRGMSGNDGLDGGAGRDRLFGGAGRDALDGGNQDDILDGEGGNDLLTGGRGADEFRFGPGGGTDRVLDFADDVDRLAFDDALWGGGLSAAEVLDQFARDRGGNVVFDFADGTRVVVENASVADLADDLSLF